MSSFNIILNGTEIFLLVVPYKNVDANEILRRLNLKEEWNYLIYYKSPDSKLTTTLDPNYPDDLKEVVPNNSTIKLLKKATNQLIYNPNIQTLINKIKNATNYLEKHIHILVWINYNFDNQSEPLHLIFMYKENYNWFEEFKTSSIEDLEEIIEKKLNDGIFLITQKAYLRFEELVRAYK